MKRYEQSIRVITALFATLLGFGLKHLLDSGFQPEHARIPCFLVALLVFLRFLLGSANHYWIEYVKPDMADNYVPDFSVVRVLFDFVALILFGVFGMNICYAETLPTFLYRLNWLAGAAVIWALVDLLRHGNSPRDYLWFAWFLINLGFIGIAIGSYQTYPCPML